jgi:putative heme-binding domain-containing protein
LRSEPDRFDTAAPFRSVFDPMKRLPDFVLLSLLLTLIAVPQMSAADDAPFEIRDGDRVLLIGDTFMEREGTFGRIELLMHTQFPDRKFTVRNLGFAGDTPLGWSRASFDPPAKGWERLKEQLDLVRPTVAFLGYGMAASLQEMTDRSGDHALNPDPMRYGAEPMSAPRFKKELAQLMDAVEAASKSEGRESKVRFVLLSPISHEDLRNEGRPRLPDPAPHNRLLAAYAKAVDELAQERSARFVSLTNPQSDYAKFMLRNEQAGPLTDNGIHLHEAGYKRVAGQIAKTLGWAFTPKPVADYREDELQSLIARKHALEDALLPAITRKNELFFHRWRPANSTYLFGFRKHEQGQNAKEIPEFDPLIAAAEVELDRLKSAVPKTLATGEQVKPPALDKTPEPVALPAQPIPQFTVQDGYQIELWAENPLLEKPTQMNWDENGRLWVCSSSLYPQIAPGEAAHDKILVLEDKDRDGKAETSNVFVDGLLIPTGVEPDIEWTSKVEGLKSNAAQKPSTLDNRRSTPSSACYVGQSTELLRFVDSDNDGKADKKRIVLSGFGTEDTHHILLTLHLGADGRLYFNQSVYIHSHLETPHGMVRLNSGGIYAYDPATERLEVFARGWWNSWGHQMDQFGQSFATDGAGSTGISWVIPGAVFPAYEGSRRIAPAISPGSYPKFCGLEIIYSPHFPADWQGNAITCDFRAHRIVRFAIKDLTTTGGQPVTDDAKSAEGRRQAENAGRIPNSPPPGGSAGYVAQEMPDFIRTSDIAFRPIDVKLGPDGALYIADWSNPVINHGEVDFRDPRRDKHRGRIWRVTKKDAPLVKWESPRGKGESPNLWDREQARSLMQNALNAGLTHAVATSSRGPANYAAMIRDANPRLRLKGIRAAATAATADAANLVLGAIANGADRDPFLEYAAWLSINELAKPWTDAIVSGTWKPEGREKQLAWGLAAIEPSLATATLSKLFAENKVPLDGTGPWIELLGKAGGTHELKLLYRGLLAGIVQDGDPVKRGADGVDPKFAFAPPVAARAAAALVEAARLRNTKPESPLPNGQLDYWPLVIYGQDQAMPDILRAVGYWKLDKLAPFVGANAGAGNSPAVHDAVFESLRLMGGPLARQTVEAFFGGPAPDQSLLRSALNSATPAIRRRALVALAQFDVKRALDNLAKTFSENATETDLLATWRELMKVKGFAEAIARTLPKDLPKPAATTGLRAARELGKKGEALSNAFASIAGVATTTTPSNAADYTAMAESVKKDGDPARGELIYRRATLGCVTCHAIGGAGGKVGPELTSLGASAPLDYIIESTLNPAAKVKEGFNAVTFTLKDGSLVSGIQARETANEIIVRDVAAREQTVPKANIASKQNIGSIMPAGLVEQLPGRERLDLLAFLAQLGKPGVYDASKGQVARVWTLYPSSDGDKVLRGELKLEDSANAFTLVDGRLTKDLFSEALQLLPNAGDVVYAVAQFQNANAGKTALQLTGAAKAWLDGKPLVVQPAMQLDLPSGPHHLVVKIDVKQLPEVLRAASADARFLGN